MYDTSGAGKAYRRLTFSGLAWWHSYKAACFKLWSVFGKEVFAPLFHCLFPNGMFFPKPKYLSNVVQIFTYIRIAYPAFKPQLDAALKMKQLPVQSKCHLLNIRTICEFCIPVVWYTLCIYLFIMYNMYYIAVFPYILFVVNEYIVRNRISFSVA